MRSVPSGYCAQAPKHVSFGRKAETEKHQKCEEYLEGQCHQEHPS